jgi:hypothetical protein
MFWFAGSCFHTVTCICVRCGRSSFRGFLCGCCSRGTADLSAVASGLVARASACIEDPRSVCGTQIELRSLAQFHYTPTFSFLLFVFGCVCVGLLVCSWTMEPPIQSPSSFWPVCAFMVCKLRKPPCLVSEEEEEEERRRRELFPSLLAMCCLDDLGSL